MKNKSLYLCRFHDDSVGNKQGRYGSFNFFADDMKGITSHESGDVRTDTTVSFKKPLVVKDEYEALKKYYPKTHKKIVDKSMDRFDDKGSPHYINSFQYIDNILANKAKLHGHDAIVYESRDGWGYSHREVQDLRKYRVKKLKVSIGDVLSE